MMKMKHLKFGLVAAGLLVSSCVLAQAKYVWIDEHGVKQFADTPPPGNIPDKNILKQPHRTAPQPAGAKGDASADSAATSDAKPAPTTADRNADFNKRRAEQAEKDKKADEEAKKQEANATNCARAKQYLDTLNSGARVSSVGSDGQRSYMDDNQRAQETQRAQQAVNDCNKG